MMNIPIPNIRAMFHDENIYPDPFSFDPTRFLDTEGRLDPSIPHPNLIDFGFGRRYVFKLFSQDFIQCSFVHLFILRTCPGRHVASDILFITVASILSTLDIQTTLDEFGKPIPVKGEEVTSGQVS